tara:strand:- start:106 stop:477 length:372 start_codon:yes stop_codon:yes gene_type:complete
MNNQEIDGRVSLCADGSLYCTADYGHDTYIFHVLTTHEAYTVYLCCPETGEHLTSGVRATDMVSGRVEIPSLLDEHYGPDMIRNETFRGLVEKAWRDPVEIKDNIDAMVTESICGYIPSCRWS